MRLIPRIYRMHECQFLPTWILLKVITINFEDVCYPGCILIALVIIREYAVRNWGGEYRTTYILCTASVHMVHDWPKLT